MHTYEIFRWVLSVLFGLIGWWIIFLNFAIVYRWHMRREHHSFVPILGGFLAFFGMGACPAPQIQRLAWIPLVVDLSYLVSSLTFGFAGMMLRRLSKEKKDDG